MGEFKIVSVSRASENSSGRTGIDRKIHQTGGERVHKRKHGEDVPETPKYVSDAEKHQEKMKKEIMEEALSRTPEKWGGDKPDDSLKSRR